MKMIISSLATLILIASSLSSIADTSDVIFIGKPLAKKNIELPACIPLTQKIGKKKTQLRDPNKVWPTIKLENEVLSGIEQYKTLLQCLENTASYSDRFTPEHLAALGEGSLAIGMPMELALMILGPPNQPPTIMGYVNPLTGKPETVKTYSWVNVWGTSGWQTFFSILGASALGVAAVTSNVNTALDSLVIASTANLTKWSLGDFSRARVVVIQVDESNQIKMFTAM